MMSGMGFMGLANCSGHPLTVPRSLNVDMEWLYGASENSNMEVDIGYIPQVSVRPVATRLGRQGSSARLCCRSSQPGCRGCPAGEEPQGGAGWRAELLASVSAHRTQHPSRPSGSFTQ